MPPHVLTLTLALLVASAAYARARADERLFGIACRSVHLAYRGPAPADAQAAAFYNEVTVDHSAPGTYFCACGFDKGYFGIQELADGKKLVIFSVWDPGSQNDPQSVAEDQRVQLLHRDERVRTGRFGNEGTGGQSFFDYDWQIGETYRFLVTARPRGQRTEFAGYFYVPEDQAWKHLITFSTLTGGHGLRGLYSFVEDFRRNRVSTTKVRSARFGNGWTRPAGGDWHPLDRATFTADSNPATNIDAGTRDGRFFLTTGGETQNAKTALRSRIECPAAGPPPSDLPALSGGDEEMRR